MTSDALKLAKAYGFELWRSGGGIRVLRRGIQTGAYVLLTDTQGEIPGMDSPCVACLYEEDGRVIESKPALRLIDALTASDAIIAAYIGEGG